MTVNQPFQKKVDSGVQFVKRSAVHKSFRDVLYITGMIQTKEMCTLTMSRQKLDHFSIWRRFLNSTCICQSVNDYRQICLFVEWDDGTVFNSSKWSVCHSSIRGAIIHDITMAAWTCGTLVAHCAPHRPYPTLWPNVFDGHVMQSTAKSNSAPITFTHLFRFFVWASA